MSNLRRGYLMQMHFESCQPGSEGLKSGVGARCHHILGPQKTDQVRQRARMGRAITELVTRKLATVKLDVRLWQSGTPRPQLTSQSPNRSAPFR